MDKHAGTATRPPSNRARRVPEWEISCLDCMKSASGGPVGDPMLTAADDDALSQLVQRYGADYDQMRAHANSNGHSVSFYRGDRWVLAGAVRNAVELDLRDERQADIDDY